MKKYLSIFILLMLCIGPAYACQIINKNGKKITKDRTIIKLCSVIVNNSPGPVVTCPRKYKKISGTFNELEQQLNYRDRLLLSKHYNRHKSLEKEFSAKGRFWKTNSSGMIHRKGCHWYKKSKGRFTKKRKGKRCSFRF
jgi:hypothetical protein